MSDLGDQIPSSFSPADFLPVHLPFAPYVGQDGACHPGPGYVRLGRRVYAVDADESLALQEGCTVYVEVKHPSDDASFTLTLKATDGSAEDHVPTNTSDTTIIPIYYIGNGGIAMDYRQIPTVMLYE